MPSWWPSTRSSPPPDSALAALGRIDTAALGEGDRAYHALLTIRAQDKCGICMPHDSTLAAVAWDYYRQHPFDNRTVRAMLSKAVTDERLGHIQDAMRWYKHVELQARQQHDTVMMNYALMSMAALYQSHYHPKEAKQKYLQVLPQLAHNTDSWLFCAFSLARIYATEHSDSCLIWSRAINARPPRPATGSTEPWPEGRWPPTITSLMTTPTA